MLTICISIGQLRGSTSRANGSTAGITPSLHPTRGTSSPATGEECVSTPAPWCISSCPCCAQASTGRAGRILLCVGQEWKHRAPHCPDGNQGLQFYQTDTFALEKGWDAEGHTEVPLRWSKHATLLFTQTNSFGFSCNLLEWKLTNIWGFDYCTSFASKKMVMVKITMRTLWLMTHFNLHTGQCCISEISHAPKGFG